METTIAKRKANAGRRKIEIKKIEDPERLRVSFSKRRKSLFNKAAQLRDKCGVEVAVIVQYPGGKINASGEKSEIYRIIDRYLAAAGTCSCGASINCGGRDRVPGKIENEKEEIKGLKEISQGPCGPADEGFPWGYTSFQYEDSTWLEEYGGIGKFVE